MIEDFGEGTSDRTIVKYDSTHTQKQSLGREGVLGNVFCSTAAHKRIFQPIVVGATKIRFSTMHFNKIQGGSYKGYTMIYKMNSDRW